MTKMNKMIDNLHVALAKVEETKDLMMDANTNVIFWTKMDSIEADIRASIVVLTETSNDSE